MIYRVLLILFLISSQVLLSNAQEVWTDKNRILPDILRQVPVALYIQHSPNPNYPEINNTGQNKNMN
jgi:hypothetical protein